MKALIQRVRHANVEVSGRVVGRIGRGILVFLGITQDDTPEHAERCMKRVVGLRIFPSPRKAMDCSLADIQGEILVVSQFTLYGDCRKGLRPSFTRAAPPEIAEPLYDHAVRYLRDHGWVVSTGEFGADMLVSLVNDGPVSLLLEYP